MCRYLDLSFCSQLTDRALRALRPLQHLKALHLDGVHRLTNAALCEALGETLSLRNPQRDLSASLGSRLRHRAESAAIARTIATRPPIRPPCLDTA